MTTPIAVPGTASGETTRESATPAAPPTQTSCPPRTPATRATTGGWVRGACSVVCNLALPSGCRVWCVSHDVQCCGLLLCFRRGRRSAEGRLLLARRNINSQGWVPEGFLRLGLTPGGRERGTSEDSQGRGQARNQRPGFQAAPLQKPIWTTLFFSQRRSSPHWPRFLASRVMLPAAY